MATKDWKKQAADANVPEADKIEVLRDFEALEANPVTGEEMTFAQLVSRKHEIDKLEKDIASEKKWIGEQLLFALGMAEQERVKVLGGHWVLKVGYGRTASKIEPTKLVELGVSVEDIQAATKEGTPYSFAQIIKFGEAEG